MTSELSSQLVIQNNMQEPDETTSLLSRQTFQHSSIWHDLRRIGPYDLRILLLYTGPLVITYLLQIGLRVTDAWFLGHLGATELAAASLGSTFCGAGLALGWGMTAAMDTLSTQAFSGANEKPYLMGVILQKSILIMFCLGALLSYFWVNAEDFLLSLRQEPILARMAQEYVNVMLIGLWPNLISACLRKYIQAQGHVPVTTYILLGSFIFNMIANWFYIRVMNLGFIGSPIAVVSTYYFIMLSMLFYIRFWTDPRFWNGWTKKAFENWGGILRLGIPGMLALSVDWAYEICVIFAGILGQTSIAAQSVIMSLNVLLTIIPLALATAATIRTGHNLGARKPDGARVSAWNAIVLGGLVALFNGVMLVSLKNILPRWFTIDEDVIRMVIDLAPIACLVVVTMAISTITTGILNATGKQKLVGLITIISYYFIGMPLGVWLTFYRDWGLLGIWWGLGYSGILKVSGEMLILYGVDWQVESIRARERIENAEMDLE